MRLKYASLLMFLFVAALLTTGFTLLAENSLAETATPSVGSEIVAENASASWVYDLSFSYELGEKATNVQPRFRIDQAENVWKTELNPSAELIKVSQIVRPRFVVHNAECAYFGSLSGSQELYQATKEVRPRFRISGAYASFTIENLERPTELERLASGVGPRIKVDGAEKSILESLEKPKLPQSDEFWKRLLLILGATAIAALLILLFHPR